MAQSKTRARTTAAVLAGGAVAAALGVATFDGGRLANDAAQYLSVAENLYAGRGIATSIIYYEEHYALHSVPAPQTVFPPGYPLAIAAVAAAGPTPTTAAFAVDLAAWVASVLLLFSIARARGHPPMVAIGAAAAFACLASVWFYVHELLSEPLFIALTLAAASCLVAPRRGAFWGALAGLCAAGAFSVRYAGIFFIVAVAAVFAVELLLHRRRRTITDALAFATPALAMVAALFWRNQALVGDFRGGNAHEVLKPLGGVLYTALESAARVVGLGRDVGIAELAALAALVLAGALAVRGRGGVSLDTAALASALRDRAVLLCAIYPLVTVAGLIYLERTTSVGLYSRMLVPLVPFVLLLLIEAGRAVRARGRASRVLARAALVSTVIAYLAGQAHAARRELERPTPRAALARALAEPLGETTVGAWLRARVDADHPVLGNEPQLLGAVLGRPVVGMTTPEYTSRIWTADAAHELVRSFDVGYVVLFPELLAAAPIGMQPPVLVELADGAVPVWLDPVHAADAVRIYRTLTRDAAEPRGAMRAAP